MNLGKVHCTNACDPKPEAQNLKKKNWTQKKKTNSNNKTLFRFATILQTHRYEPQQVQDIFQWQIQATHILVERKILKIAKYF